MTRDLEQFKTKELFWLPVRDRDTYSSYSSLLILHTKKKFKTKHCFLTIIGCKGGLPTEIAATCDSIEWSFNKALVYTDVSHKGRRSHMFGKDVNFTVGYSDVTTKIIIEDKNAIHKEEG